jgi:homoserine O-acetyltransferase
VAVAGYAQRMNLSIRLLVHGLALVWGFGGAAWAEDGAQQVAELGSCPLSSGQVIQDCRVGYRVFGRLNASRSNVVIMPTWLNGRSDDLVPLAFDAFGDGVSSSPSNSKKQHGPAFPVFTMEDMVRAQYRVLTEVLHVEHVHAAVGLSMGGEQVFAWAVLYPKFVDLAVPIVGTPQVTTFDLLSKQIVIDAIEADPEYKGGMYTAQPPLKLANAIGAQMVTAPQYRNAEHPRESFAAWQDANDRVWQAKAIMLHDVLHGRTLEDVARSAPVKFLVIVAAEDRMVTPQPALAWAKAVEAETYISQGTCAHLIMSCDAEAVSERVERFLGR